MGWSNNNNNWVSLEMILGDPFPLFGESCKIWNALYQLHLPHQRKRDGAPLRADKFQNAIYLK